MDFAIGVAVAKYLEHLPLARHVRQMGRAGLTVDTQTLWDQLLALSHHLTPTYEALLADVRTAPVLGADETTWQLMEPGRSKHRSRPWSLPAFRRHPLGPDRRFADGLTGLFVRHAFASARAMSFAGRPLRVHHSFP